MVAVSLKKNFFKQKTAYEITTRLVGSEMCIRDRVIGTLYEKVTDKDGKVTKNCLLYTSDAADD